VRFAAEFAMHRALWLAGFPTVEPVGYAWRRRGWGSEGIYMTRLVEAESWPRRWDLSDHVVPSLREAVAALCAWGLWAPDLNATNVLIPASGGILLLDWDRAQFTSPDGLGERYRARLSRSLRKLGAPAAFFDPLS
jgi:RIO-like serine/threonine protein kinase